MKSLILYKNVLNISQAIALKVNPIWVKNDLILSQFFSINSRIWIRMVKNVSTIFTPALYIISMISSKIVSSISSENLSKKYPK